MAESMVSIVVALAVIAAAVWLVASRYWREHCNAPLRGRLDGHRLWNRMRHRH